MRLHSRLLEVMLEKKMKVDELRDISGVSKFQIVSLRGSDWSKIDRDAFGRIASALRIEKVGDLLALYPEDIWAPIKVAREVTIHFGFNSFPEVTPHLADETRVNREFVGSWDVRAFFCIWEYLSKLGLGINLKFQAHVTGGDGSGALREQAQRVFDGGSHIVIGSPLANFLAEEVVSRAYHLPRAEPGLRKKFPYFFVWDAQTGIRSSFGELRERSAAGIASARTGRLVARRTFVRPHQIGEDCALLVAHRVSHPSGEGGESIVLVILGHSGPGTFAGAQIVTDPKYAADLYPAHPNVPRMRVVTAEYRRQGEGTRDTREVISAQLVPEPRGKLAAKKRRVYAKRRRNTRPAKSEA